MEKMEDNTSRAWLKLLVRNIPFILSRKDIGGFRPPASGELVRYFSLDNSMTGVNTLGAYANVWANHHGEKCPRCGGKGAYLLALGSPLSGAGKCSEWFCPSCQEIFKAIPDRLMRLFSEVRDASLREGPILSYFQVTCPDLECHPSRLAFDEVSRLVKHISGEASSTLEALGKIASFDELASGCVEMKYAASITFCLMKGQTSHFVCFSNESGCPTLSSKLTGENRISVEWDECWGLLPALQNFIMANSSSVD